MTRSHCLDVEPPPQVRWDQVDFERGLLHVRRVKSGTPSVYPLGGTELRSLRRLLRSQPESRHVFLTERRSPMSAAGFRKMFARTGKGSEFPFPVHPHMLRHVCGYKLANDGQDMLAGAFQLMAHRVDYSDETIWPESEVDWTYHRSW